MGNIVLITGGTRSGKSRFAEQLASKAAGDDVFYIATAELWDDEMRRRAALHRARRPQSWLQCDAPRNLGEAIRNVDETAGASQRTLLIECLTLLVTNVMLACGENASHDAYDRAVRAEIDSLLEAAVARKRPVIIVSGEVGLGLVPDNRLGRMFQDQLGPANQAVANRAAAVYLVVAGRAIDLNRFAADCDEAAQLLTGKTK